MLVFGIGSQLTEVDDIAYFFEVWLIVFGLIGLKCWFNLLWLKVSLMVIIG